MRCGSGWTGYHVVLDSTRIELEACIEIIGRAAGSLASGTGVPSENGFGERRR